MGDLRADEVRQLLPILQRRGARRLKDLRLLFRELCRLSRICVRDEKKENEQRSSSASNKNFSMAKTR